MEQFIRKVNKLAYQSAQQGNDPFAALLVKNDTVVASTMDYFVKESDPTAHAELDLIRIFCQGNNIFSLEGYTLYSSSEPCAQVQSTGQKLTSVVFSVSQQKLNGVSNGKRKPSCDSVVNVRKSKVDVIGPILKDEGFQFL